MYGRFLTSSLAEKLIWSFCVVCMGPDIDVESRIPKFGQSRCGYIPQWWLW